MFAHMLARRGILPFIGAFVCGMAAAGGEKCAAGRRSNAFFAKFTKFFLKKVKKIF